MPGSARSRVDDQSENGSELPVPADTGVQDESATEPATGPATGEVPDEGGDVNGYPSGAAWHFEGLEAMRRLDSQCQLVLGVVSLIQVEGLGGLEDALRLVVRQVRAARVGVDPHVGPLRMTSTGKPDAFVGLDEETTNTLEEGLDQLSGFVNTADVSPEIRMAVRGLVMALDEARVRYPEEPEDL